MKNYLKNSKLLQVYTKRIFDGHFLGSFSTRFKGQGLQFSDLREYEYGDDVRLIDWRVSARTQSTYVKKYDEERDICLYFCIDESASQQFSTSIQSKLEMSRELVSYLLAGALSRHDQVGLIRFNHGIVNHIHPKKDQYQYQRIFDALWSEPSSEKASLPLNSLFEFILKTLKRRCILVLVSDFFDSSLDFSLLSKLARVHEVICFHVNDSWERSTFSFPYAVDGMDLESHEMVKEGFPSTLKKIHELHAQMGKKILSSGCDYRLFLTSDDPYAALVQYLQMRRSWSRR